MNGRFCLPRVRGRGAGLGNELIPWARAAVAAHMLGARTLAPAFGLNPRPYRRYFNTSRFDWISHRMLERALPCFEFTEADFLDFGGGSLSVAIRSFAEKHHLIERSAWVLATEGMWGGYRHIIEARDFIFSTLYLSNRTANNLAIIRSRLNPACLTIGMHVRLGDFRPTTEVQTYQGQFNVSLPIEWYVNVARSIVEHLGNKAQFLIVSDGTSQQLAPLLNCCNAITTLDIPDSDISDMLALAKADLLVCSVSSYSSFAAFLSDAPYLWFEPNLQKIDGFYSIWGHEPGQLDTNGYTRKAMDDESEPVTRALYARGLPVGLSGALPESLFERIAARKQSMRAEFDLIYHGAVPIISRDEQLGCSPTKADFAGNPIIGNR